MSGLYLILRAHFYKEDQDKYGKYLSIFLKNRSRYMREFLEENNKLNDSLLDEIDLASQEPTPKLHSSATIIAKYYEKGNIPSTEELVSDIKYFLELRKFLLENYKDDTEITSKEWIIALEDKNIIDNKMFNILKIMYHMDDYKATTSQLVEKREKLGFVGEKSYNSTIIANSRNVKEFLNKKTLYNEDGSENFWMRFFYGEHVKVEKDEKQVRAFQFKLKDELVDALGKINRKDFDAKIIESVEVDNMEYEKTYDSFYDYLIKRGYLFDKEIIENYLLSLKVKPFAILTGNSGTGKTKLSQLFAKYISENNKDSLIDDKILDSDDYITVKAKTNYSSWANQGWTLNKEDFKNIIPISECEGTFNLEIDGIPAKGTISLLAQLYYDKNNDDLINYFNNLYNVDPNQVVDLKINRAAIEEISSDDYIETNGSIILKQNSNASAYDKRQWFMSKDLFNYLPFSNGYTECEIIVNDIRSSAKMRIVPKLTFKKNFRLQEYLKENDGKEVEVKINVDKFGFEDFKPFWQLEKEQGEENSDSDNIYENYKIIPVGANWTENRNIVGYYNVITNKYESTPAYDLIKQSQGSNEPHFLILDEMNLSHVERYFADFLSSIESGEDIPLYGTEPLEIPSNLFIIGTVNVDETTYMFSPKVLDRANVLEFETPSARDYILGNIDNEAPDGDLSYLEDPMAGCEVRNYDIDKLRSAFEGVKFDGKDFWEVLSLEIDKFQTILKGSGFEFGFRVINEIIRFMLVAWRYEGSPEEWNGWERYFDAQIKQKILPKLHGSEKIIGETLEKLYKECLDTVIDDKEMKKYPESSDKLEEMIDVLRKQRYVSFIN